MPEHRDFSVTLHLHVSTRVTFSRETAKELEGISKSDAVDNAIGMLDYGNDDLVTFFGDQGFSIALPIEGDVSEDA